MNDKDKIALLKELIATKQINEYAYYDAVRKCEVSQKGYDCYMTTSPINCDVELHRLPTADYDLCCALLTMLLREDHFCNGSFERRYANGEVTPIIERMIMILEGKQKL